MRHKLPVLLFAVILFASCNCEKKAIETKPAEAPKAQQSPSDGVNALNNLVVSFYSKGSGIDRDAWRRFEDFLVSYSAKTNTPVPYKKIGWGREGEFDFCVTLSAMTAGQRDKFIAEARELLKPVELVHIYENRPCRDMK
jgi:hypothetical protein